MVWGVKRAFTFSTFIVPDHIRARENSADDADCQVEECSGQKTSEAPENPEYWSYVKHAPEKDTVALVGLGYAQIQLTFEKRLKSPVFIPLFVDLAPPFQPDEQTTL